MKIKQIFHLVKFLIGPWMIIPLAFTIALIFGAGIYEWPESSGDYEKYLFFQGNIDMGGACLFAGTLMLYLFFGFTAAWYLVLKLDELEVNNSFSQTITKAFWYLKFHILAFIIGGTMNLGYDARVTPNDFRNMFLLAGLLYLLSIFYICILHKLKVSRNWKLILAPIFMILWFAIGSDGNTASAGQLVSSETNPHYIIRSKKHGIMMSWHKLCDSIFRDID